ncbi:MAG: acetylxylan esterase, partial [Acidobacteriota bacterium]|nr:acetylxylan esterase [Acidobacteriota bacterium]
MSSRTALAATILAASLAAQTSVDTKNWTAEQDHQNMMDQLGIKALRPGPSGNEAAPNHANYDESKANPFPDLPDALTLKNGKKVTTAAQWWKQRRPEIVEDFDREVLGRVPKNAPKIHWEVTKLAETKYMGHDVVAKQIVGHADNSGDPDIKVDIQMTLVVPADAKKPVPVMMMFGGRTVPEVAFPAPVFPGRAGRAGAGRAFTPPPQQDPPATEQLIADGWGFATINPNSVQADNGAGLTKGIIGLVNKGQP